MAVCVVFGIMAYFYTYVDPAEIEAQFAEMEPEEKKKKDSVELQKRDSVEKHHEERKASSSSSSSEEEEGKQSKM